MNNLSVVNSISVSAAFAFPIEGQPSLAGEREAPAGMVWIPGAEFSMDGEDHCESYRPSARRGTPTDTRMSHIGFRCALSGAGASKQQNNSKD
jgi:formylglycine-generating enzyme required for sulfatase activity